MVSILLSVVVFWLWPASDLRRAQKVTGIGAQGGERLDDETVQLWRKGRIRCRKLWLNFGTAVVVGSMMSWVIDTFWAEGGAAPDPKLAQCFGLIVSAAVTVGLLGSFVSLLMSAANNKKHLGQFRVTL
jgi:F0F1-type ATP synthase assembly protein I